jgi:hypothetical protein
LLKSGSIHEVRAASLELGEPDGDEDDEGRDGESGPPQGGTHLVGDLVEETVKIGSV